MTEDNMKKGKLAEKIVKQMFKDAGFKVVQSGYENTFSQLANQYNLLQGEAAQYIRHHPDFIVVNSHNEAFLIEVKYRRLGVIDQNAIFNYPATQVILLTKDSMHCQSLKEIHKNGKKFISLDYLRPFSDIPVEIRNKYIRKTRRLLGDENLIGQLIESISEKIVGKKFGQSHTPGDIRFTFIEDFNNEGDSYERTDEEEIITDKHGKERFSNHGKQWNHNEIKTLMGLYKSGKSIDEIASILRRRREAVIFRLVKERMLNMRQVVKLVRKKNGNRKSRHRKNKHKRNKRKSHHKRKH